MKSGRANTFRFERSHWRHHTITSLPTQQEITQILGLIQHIFFTIDEWQEHLYTFWAITLGELSEGGENRMRLPAAVCLRGHINVVSCLAWKGSGLVLGSTRHQRCAICCEEITVLHLNNDDLYMHSKACLNYIKIGALQLEISAVIRPIMVDAWAVKLYRLFLKTFHEF